MNTSTCLKISLFIVGVLVSAYASSVEHPGLTLTKAGVEKIRAELGTVPLFDTSVAQVKAEVDAEIASGIHTPIPKDFSGGYTHQRHKQNFYILPKAGALFQILEDEKYAIYIRDMLFQYEAMYKDLPLHPQIRSYARGKLFWQNLNDANWLVYVSQAYDAIYNWLSEEERETLENNLFRPFADHISIDSPQFFNRVHNHSTWGNAAVGLIGLVMDDEELIQRALYGLNFDDIDTEAKDNDGGFIYSKDGKAGFLANLDEPFSPDGYYTEGPYYQRYAMYPFLIFAQGLNNMKPELKIFEHKKGVLLKAVDALLNLSDADGDFFPLNDGQKGMSYHTRELISGVDISYYFGGENPQLLSIAEEHGQVLLDDTGFAVAAAIRDGKTEPFTKASINLSDGPNGNQGGIAILRQGDEKMELVYKYAAQGLSHGHYDKLSFSYHENGEEVLQDYGLSRFVNIGQKGGGNYLPENQSWAKQTIAHNTLTINETSHFQGKYETGSQHHSELRFYDDSNPNVQITSALETNAYPGSMMKRTLALIQHEAFEKPFMLDIFKVESENSNQYDLPFYYFGQVLKTNFEYESPETLAPLGEKNGYQHLYLEGKGKASGNNAKFAWMNNNIFYSLTSTTKDSDELLLTRIGANDPQFNLRRDPALILRRKSTADTTFVSVLESHGSYSPVTELAFNSDSHINELKIALDNKDYTAVTIEDMNEKQILFIVANENSSADKKHHLSINGQAYHWSGPYFYTDID